MAMPPPPMAPLAPYLVSVEKVQSSGADVSGTSFLLENLTKGTSITKSSSESDSNITINLDDCGDWDLGDTIKITATYLSLEGISTHSVVEGDNGIHDFGIIAVADPVPLVTPSARLVIVPADARTADKAYNKVPNAVLDYAFDWNTTWLQSGETITSHEVTVTEGLTRGSDTESDGLVTAWLSGGTVGGLYLADCKIISSLGRTEVCSIQINCTEH